MTSCTLCGTELRRGAKFCDECGAPTAMSVDASEYKQVTVLFADVVRSMDIAAALEIERLREVMTGLTARAAAVVEHYGGTVEYNGDGIMALFGAPAALEDHAFRACLAAVAIQEQAAEFATEVQRHDGVSLRLRVGLNSGRVIAGETGLGYAATGETVGFAERMESAAPPGGVVVSESTARLVDDSVELAPPEWVHIKGTDEPVRARRLLAIGPRRGSTGHSDLRLVGRRWEMAALDAIVDRAIDRRGGVVNVVGPPGIGKSRVGREVAALAAARGVDVFWSFCESHASDIPFHVATQLMRAASGVADRDGQAARTWLESAMPDADRQDLALLADALGFADPGGPLPQIDPDARRRRLTALINAATLCRTEPALLIVEDVHWIDTVSEAMLADFLTIIPRTSTMVLVTSRPEYRGALTRVRGGQAIALAPLGDSEISAMLRELLGPDPSVRDMEAVIAHRAAGNPFFAEEMARELMQRGVLVGERGALVCHTDAADVTVPATVQAAIKARIDRLSRPVRHTLNAASVIGARFDPQLLSALGADATLGELIEAELIDQVRFTPSAEYAFRHPLIRAVAYESQLKADRAETHRRLAAAIQERDPSAVEENAALLAEHLEAAGDLHAAYGWHMRAGAWSSDHGAAAARLSWRRACRIADSLPEGDAARMPMRIAPRSMLSATDWLARQGSRSRFAELRQLCDAAGDRVSLAIGMSGLATELLFAERPREGSRLASEQMALLESIGDPNLTVGLSFVAFANWFNSGDFDKIARWSQTVVDLCDGDAAIGAGFGLGSPLAVALAFRGIARWWMGRSGWREDFDDAVVMGRNSDATTFALTVGWTIGLGTAYGICAADDSVLHMADEAHRKAQRGSNDFALEGTRFNLGLILLYRDSQADRDRGLELMLHARDISLPVQASSLVPVAAVWVARERARRGERDAALAEMRKVVDVLHREERIGWEVISTQIVTETLLDGEQTVAHAEAEQLIDRLATLPSVEDSAILEITLLKLRALLARARGDDIAYTRLAGQYQTMAQSLGFQGHIAWAEAMTE